MVRFSHGDELVSSTTTLLWHPGKCEQVHIFVLFISAFLVKHLEKWSCELNFDPKFVFHTMQEIGVTIFKLHEIYDRLFKSKVWPSATIQTAGGVAPTGCHERVPV